MADVTLNIMPDGAVVKSVRAEAEGMPTNVTIPLNNALQMKIFTSDMEAGGIDVGLANITLK